MVMAWLGKLFLVTRYRVLEGKGKLVQSGFLSIGDAIDFCRSGDGEDHGWIIERYRVLRRPR